MRSFFATARMCAREKGYFGLMECVGQYLARCAGLLLLLYLWRVLLGQGADAQGLTLAQIMRYTLLSGALEPLLDVRTPASNWLHDGTILSLYLRPAPLFSSLVAHTVGGWIPVLLLFSLPVLCAASALGIELRPATPWFYPSVALSVSQGFAVDFLFACLLIRMKNLEWTVHSIRQALTALLTGALIPFSLLPWGLGDLFALSPLGTLAGAPLSLYAGLEAPMPLIAAQGFWNVVLWPVALMAMRASRERMVSYGG